VVGDRRLILASASPRRRQLLAQIGVAFEVDVADVDEGDDPRANALAKARAVAARHRGEDAVVLGADTEVVLDGDVLGKPADDADAREMLRRLSGRTHAVVTAYALVDCTTDDELVRSVETGVTFRPLTGDEIDAYVATGEPLDKAGAYGIQGRGAVLVDRIDGDYFTVVGLPLADLWPRLGDCRR
jgi:septum formation protein